MFQRCFIAAEAVIDASDTFRPLVALDVAHLTSKYKGTLLVASGIDANDEVLPLAWAVVDAENSANWLWCCKHFKQNFGVITRDNSVIISDRDKSLMEAIKAVFPRCHLARCCWHIAHNVQDRFWPAARIQFWRWHTLNQRLSSRLRVSNWKRSILLPKPTSLVSQQIHGQLMHFQCHALGISRAILWRQ